MEPDILFCLPGRLPLRTAVHPPSEADTCYGARPLRASLLPPLHIRQAMEAFRRLEVICRRKSGCRSGSQLPVRNFRGKDFSCGMAAPSSIRELKAKSVISS